MKLKDNTLPAAAACTAVSAGLFCIGPFLSPVGILFAIMSPLPLAYLGWRGPPKAMPPALMASSIVVSLVLGPMAAVEHFFMFGLGGTLLGVGIRHNWRPHVAIGAVVVSSLMGFAILIGVGAFMAGVGPVELLSQLAAGWTAPLRAALEAEREMSNIAPDLIISSTAALDAVEYWMSRLAPGITTGLAIMVGGLNAQALRRFLTDRGEAVPAWTGWKAPEYWVWVLIVAGSLTALGSGWISALGLNLLIPAAAVYFIQGMLILQFLMEAKAASRLIRMIVFVMIFLNIQITLPALALIGAFDQWVDFRAKMAPKPEDEN